MRFVLMALAALLVASPAVGQIKAQARSAPTPPWDKGILPISPESYWHAVECGKLGGEDPPCVFWDTSLCKNGDFTLALYTPYKMVAYAVWSAVRQKKEPPTPSFQQAQQTRVTVGVTPVKGSKNALKELVLKRGGKVVPPVARAIAPRHPCLTNHAQETGNGLPRPRPKVGARGPPVARDAQVVPDLSESRSRSHGAAPPMKRDWDE